MASLLSGLGSAASGAMSGIGAAGSAIGSGIGAAAKAGNSLLASDIGGTAAGPNLAGAAGVGQTGINWGDILKAAQSGGDTKGMLPLVNKAMLAQNNANKRTDLQEAIMIASALWGGGI